MPNGNDPTTSAYARPEGPVAENRTAELAAHVARRVAASHGARPLDKLLADEIPGNELTTLLLHCLRQRALRRSFGEVFDHATRAPMTRASTADARRFHAFDGVAFAAAARFEAVELAPVEPLGAASCAGVDPNNVLSTVRFAEVAADPATGLALHAARLRRGAKRSEPLRLCASQRVLRLQPTTNPEYSPHFRLFALLTAARSPQGREDDPCERAALLEHLVAWTDLVRALPGAGFRAAGLRVVLADTRVVRACLESLRLDVDAMARRAKAHDPAGAEDALREAGVDLPRAAADPLPVLEALGVGAPVIGRARSLVREVGAQLASERPEVDVVYDLARLQGLGYYAGPFIQLIVRRDDGVEFPVGDGGALPWLGELLSNRRERVVVTGLGSELLVKLFDGSPAFAAEPR